MPIVIEGLTYIYNKGQRDETRALNNVFMNIGDGSIVGIIGHTGSGKSTLIQHMNGLLIADSGSILIDGIDMIKEKRLLELRRKVGLVFQYPEYQLFEETVWKDIAFGPHNLGLSEQELSERVSAAARLTGLDLEIIGERSPFELSGGQKRKVAIAGVLAMQPEVLVLDEPAAGLDPKAHEDMLELLLRANREHGCTIIIISHDMDDIAAICDKVYVMENGSVVMGGTPEEIFSKSEKLIEMGLGLPAAAELMRELSIRGFDVPEGILNEAEAANIIADILIKR